MMRTETRREAALIALLCACVTIVYTPTGERIAIPAGAEIDVCSKDGVRLAYDLAAFVIRVPQPCSERPLFADGFEGKRFQRRIMPVPKSR